MTMTATPKVWISALAIAMVIVIVTKTINLTTKQL